MPFALELRRGTVMYVRAWGNVTFAECAALLDEVLDDTRLVPHTRILVDAHRVSEAPSAAELRTLVRDLYPLRSLGVDAIAIYTDSAFVYGMARMFAILAEISGLRVGVFRNRTEAEWWLNSIMVAA